MLDSMLITTAISGCDGKTLVSNRTQIDVKV